MIEFTKENVMAMIRNNVEGRISCIDTLGSHDYPNDQKPAIAAKLWELYQIDNAIFWSLMNRLHVEMSLEGWENLESILGNLMDDSYFGIVYKPYPESEFIHLSAFGFEWVNDDVHPHVLYPEQWPPFLDWFIDYAKKLHAEAVLDENDDDAYAIRCSLAIVKDWNKYPPVLKIAYDLWEKKRINDAIDAV